MHKPMLEKFTLNQPSPEHLSAYPFSIALIKNLTTINFPTQVTFFVGENGSGKSTILEALAIHAGFGPEGGSRNIYFSTTQASPYNKISKLHEYLTLTWRQKPKDGYFFRAECFFNLANYLDELALTGGEGPRAYDPYGGKSLHAQSHGESFLAFFKNRVGQHGFFILDEPEAALSPQRQLSLLSIIHRLCSTSNTQFIIATHSPLLLAYPKSTIYSCDNDLITTISYRETDHYQTTKRFLNDPERYLHYLFNQDE